MSFTKVAPAGIGTEPGSEIRIGDSLLHSTGLDIGTGSGIGVTIRQHGDATFTGIITASAFFGDGSGLEGVSSSGIGTPLSDDDTSDLNKIYYANQELVIDSTVTVNHPDTGIAAYTHYQDLVVKDNADFIVADGDTFIPDVLGIRTSTSTASAATGGRIRAGTITNAGANGAPNFPNGITVTGVVTATTINQNITGDLSVTGNLDVTNVDSVGVITARDGIRIGATGANSLITGNANGIGIKTAAPSSLALEIASPFNDIARMVGPNSGNITFRNATANEVILHTGNSDALIFGTNGNNERIRIGTSGQIGIGGANYGTSGQVLKSGGSGAAPAWGAGGNFTSYAIVAEVRSGTSDAGTLTANTWMTRAINTEIADPDGIVSISSNQFTLQAGTYLIEWSAPAWRCDRHTTRLYDVTNSAARGNATLEFSQDSGSYTQSSSRGFARVTISGATVYKLETKGNVTKTTDGLGVDPNNLASCIYAMAKIFKEV